jgi:amidase
MAGSGLDSLAGLVVTGPIARTVADAAFLFDALVAAAPWSHATRAPVDPPLASGAAHPHSGPFLGAAVRGEGRYQLGVTSSSPWEAAVELTLDAEARWAVDEAVAVFDRLGHGIESLVLDPEPDYSQHFRAVWMAGASRIPARSDAELALLEPLTRWLVAQGRALSAETIVEALDWLSAFERRLINQLSRFDAVLTPALAMTPRPLGWFDAVDAERNFTQQVQYTPFTSLVNVAGLPAITLPVGLTPAGSEHPGVPMGVQLIGRPGGEATLLALGAQLERSLGTPRIHPPQW